MCKSDSVLKKESLYGFFSGGKSIEIEVLSKRLGSGEMPKRRTISEAVCLNHLLGEPFAWMSFTEEGVRYECTIRVPGLEYEVRELTD